MSWWIWVLIAVGVVVVGGGAAVSSRDIARYLRIRKM